MNILQRPYTSEADLSAILALKQVCATSQNLYDRPTTSDVRRLLTLPTDHAGQTMDEPDRQQTFQGLSPEHRYRALTRRLTRLWEDERGQLMAYALIAQPGSSLTFQVHPRARGQGLEEAILTWGLAQMQALAHARGVPRELWCRCHESEHERRRVLEAAGFRPLFEPDLRLIHALATPVPLVPFPHGYSLKLGVTQAELDAYQELHRVVFDGVSINMEYHESSFYQPELDLVAVEESGQFAAFCQCELKQVTDQQSERLVGEVGLIGTRPDLTRRGLGRALLLTGLRRLQEGGATSVYLETSELNVLAQRLFTSVGFVQISTWQWYAK